MKTKFKANTVILLSVDVSNARSISDRMQGEYVEDYRNHEDLRELEEGTDYYIYGNNDFIYEINEGNIDLTDDFLIFINTPL